MLSLHKHALCREVLMKEKKDTGKRILFFLIGLIVRIVCGIWLKLKITKDETVRKWQRSKDPLLILCAHPSEMDAVVLLAASFPRYTRFVAGALQLYKPGMQSRLLNMIGVIPKKQFTPDIGAVKEMMLTVKNGDALAMMPEGRVSIDGTPSSIDISTAKLIKKLGANVAVLIPHGTFFVKPSYNYSGIIPGKMSGELKGLLHAEEITAKTADEILDTVSKALEYDASEELRGSGCTYGKKESVPMDGVSNLFYRCPSCGELFTVSDKGGVISCESCGLSLQAQRNMFMECTGSGADKNAVIPDTVAGWNALQKEWEKEFWSQPDAELVLDVRKDTMILKEETEYTTRGNGTLRLSAAGLEYTDGEESFSVPLGAVPGVSADYKYGHIVFYQGDIMRRFVFNDKRLTARFINSLMTLKNI